jgi:hypothetical protein
MSKPLGEEIAAAVERARSRREAYENQQGQGEGSSAAPLYRYEQGEKKLSPLSLAQNFLPFCPGKSFP